MRDITDWRINVDSGSAVVFFPAVSEPSEAEKLYAKDLIESVKRDAAGRLQFSISVKGHTADAPNNRFRVQHLSGPVYGLRRILDAKQTLADLGLHRRIQSELMTQELDSGGLILISGPTGSGKTTTAVTTIRERLNAYGGYCLAIEDPIEYELGGMHGTAGGYCDQIEAEGPDDYSRKVMQAMRLFPAKTRGLLYLGEIRDEVTATEAVRVGLSGFLVVSTVHSFGAISTIQRILALMGGEDSPSLRSLLSDALKLIVHQKWEDSKLVSTMLPKDDRVKGAIKAGKFDALKDDLNLINIQMRSSRGG